MAERTAMVASPAATQPFGRMRLSSATDSPLSIKHSTWSDPTDPQCGWTLRMKSTRAFTNPNCVERRALARSKIDMNRVPVAPHGLILGEDGATASGKLFKWLPGPFPPVWGPTITKRHRCLNKIYTYTSYIETQILQ